MSRAILLLGLLLGGCSFTKDGAGTAQAPRYNEWLVTERVTFEGTSDPDVIELGDGTRLEVLYEDRSTWETVSALDKATALTYAYSTVFGCALIHSESRTQLVVYGGFGSRHPLDLLLARNLALAPTTISIVEAYDASIARWSAEIDRLHRFLQERSDVPDELKAALRVEQRAWGQWLEAHGAASAGLHRLPDGTMWGVKSLESHHGTVRQHALRLLQLVEPLSAVRRLNW